LASFCLPSISRHTRWPRDCSSDVCSADLGRATSHHTARSCPRASRLNKRQRGQDRAVWWLVALPPCSPCPESRNGVNPLKFLPRSEKRRVGKEYYLYFGQESTERKALSIL